MNTETKTDYPGIDYGLGRTNRDTSGFSYGVINISSLHEWIWDELESDYGKPHCRECGNELPEGFDDGDACACGHTIKWIGDECYPDEPLGDTLQSKDYDAHSAFDRTTLFVTRSPYYTHAQFCSPCAPGAGNLDSPCDTGPKTLCFGHGMFDEGKAPYRVFRCADDTEVMPED